MNQIWVEDRAILIKADDDTIKILKQHFTWQDSSEAMSMGRFDSRKVKDVCLIHKKGEFHWMYSGFLMRLVRIIKEEGLSFKLEKDLRTKLDIQIPSDNELQDLFDDMKPYDYQMEAVKAILKSKVGILKLPTSAGKSYISALILKWLNKPFLFLVNKKGLAFQTWKEFNRLGLDCGVCYSGKYVMKPSMVCTIGSIKRIKNLHEIKVLLIDETHRASSSQFQEFLKTFLPPIRIGLSATPEGNSKYKYSLIEQFMGEVSYTIKAKQLIDKKVIAEPFIFFVENFVNGELDWRLTEEKQIIKNEERNGLIAEFVNGNEGHCILVLVSRRDHGKSLQSLIPGSVYLDGEDSVKEREIIKDKMESGEQKVVITTGIFNEGISIKAIEVLINASARKSFIETIQKLGRALRIKDGKERSVIIDFEDNGNGFLKKQSMTRKSSWKKEGFTNIRMIKHSNLKHLNVKDIL